MLRYAWMLAIPLMFSMSVRAQERRGPDMDRARHVVSKTLDDLRHVERHEEFAREDHERYERAMRDLEDTRHDLDEGRIDRERLDRAIEEVEHVARAEMVGPREREQLAEDSRELRRLREDWHWER
jgi:hypothetical protein